jgi:hypothetical protein
MLAQWECSKALAGTHREQNLVAQSLAVDTHHALTLSLRKTVMESRRSRQRERKGTPPPR